MKASNIAILFFISFFLTACETPLPKEEDSKTEHSVELKMENVSAEDVEIIEIEGCEYIVYKHHEGANLGYGFMAHKGNCKNPIHCYNKLPIGVDTTTIDSSLTKNEN